MREQINELNQLIDCARLEADLLTARVVSATSYEIASTVTEGAPRPTAVDNVREAHERLREVTREIERLEAQIEVLHLGTRA